MKARVKDENVLDTGLTLYDVNKQLVSQLPDYTEEQLEEAIKTIDSYIQEFKASYYMLLNKEIGYYTILHITNCYVDEPLCCSEALECVKDHGTIKSVARTENDAIEIWFKQKHTGDIYVMYFFAYDGGVIECRM
jgi:hypothetical protein